MDHRSPALTFAALLTCVFLFMCAASAQAHRLDGQAFVLPDQRVQIESWFSSGDPARGARVQVFRSDRSLLTDGLLDEKGIFVFGPIIPEKLTVVISAGMGHRKELTIMADDLARTRSTQAENQDTPALDPVPLTDRTPTYPLKDILLGITFLLAAAAFVMSLRNQRRLKDHTPGQ